MRRAVIIDRDDNVATAIDDLMPGETIALELEDGQLEVAVAEPIKFGHKLALKPMPSGSSVVKYNEIIGTTTKDIKVGELVHRHNLVTNRADARAMEQGSGEA